MIVVSRAARKTDAPREAMMIVVCNFVREASGSVGDGVLGSMAEGEGGASSSMLVEESFGMSFSEGAGVDSPLVC
jgi:citrate lyase alpha subunit